ncbi:cache domain-containing sensor histidine kinase [Paenibacillus turpanensis]|uniref:cache domain-containing sensor histidine kinase n=1 Tax=Paenibacillus turpanensis TaxID=2689078 RepID=UPI00140B8A50|nr:sensor histidine kinase [Paenibacillus turpanensis]
MNFIRTSIRSKLIVFMLIATVIPIATSILITYFYTKESVTEQSVSENLKLTQQGKINIINYLNVVDKNSMSVYIDTFYEDTIYKIIDRDYDDTASNQQITKALLVTSQAVKEIVQVNLHLLQSDRSFLMRQGFQISTRGNGTKLERPEKAYGAFIEPPHITHGYGIQLPSYYSRPVVLSMHRPIYRLPTEHLLGFLSIDISMDMIRQLCSQLYVPGEEELFIFDKKGTIIYSPNPAEIGQPKNESWVTEALSEQLDQNSYEWRDDKFQGVHLVTRMTAEYLDWTMVKRIPNDMLFRDARTITGLNTQVLFGFLIVTVTATVFLSFRITKPIRGLIGYMNAVQTGNFNADIEVQSQDEIGLVARRFRSLMQTINKLIMQEYRLELANKTYQLKTLQAQINPHFLNNALQSIGTLALQSGAPHVYKLISSLGKMMRYSMNNEETVVPLHKELDYVKAFLELQKQRFGDRFQFIFDIEETTQDISVPKMVLQPIVENYFKHGMGAEKSTAASEILRISSKLYPTSGETVITIWNNGPSVDPGRLQILQRTLYRPDSSSARDGDRPHIGLVNVAARLRLFFGEEALILAENTVEPNGFKITLHIPLSKEAGEPS